MYTYNSSSTVRFNAIGEDSVRLVNNLSKAVHHRTIYSGRFLQCITQVQYPVMSWQQWFYR